MPAHKNNNTSKNRFVFLNSVFPCISETFIYDQLDILLEAGLPVDIVSNNKPLATEVHPRMRGIQASVHYLSETKILAALAASASLLIHHPISTLRVITQLLFPSRDQPQDSLKTRLSHVIGAAILIQRYEGTRSHFHANFSYGATAVALLLKQLAGRSYSLTLHGSDLLFDNPPNLSDKLAQADSVVSISEFNIQYLHQQYPALIEQPYKVIPLGVDSAHGKKKQKLKPGDTFKCLNIGRLDVHKGQHVLIDAINQLKVRGVNVSCDIIGAGPKRQQLRDLIDRFNLQDEVNLLGLKYHNEVLDLLPTYDAYVMSSIVEGMPIALMEAMRARVPIITTDVGAIPELLDGGNCGLLVPSNDAAALANAIEITIDDVSMSEARVDAATAFVQARFDLKKNSLRLADYLSEFTV
ncbi:MAG: colanic acid/amylovoran biosynthesis glycosyltransferase [Arenicella sp.]|jgi:colanic acid/amylovoran biosynthesis glycosyltransferase